MKKKTAKKVKKINWADEKYVIEIQPELARNKTLARLIAMDLMNIARTIDRKKKCGLMFRVEKIK